MIDDTFRFGSPSHIPIENFDVIPIVLVNISVVSYTSKYKQPIITHHEKKVTKGFNYDDYFKFLRFKNKPLVKFYCIQILSSHGFTKQIKN